MSTPILRRVGASCPTSSSQAAIWGRGPRVGGGQHTHTHPHKKEACINISFVLHHYDAIGAPLTPPPTITHTHTNTRLKTPPAPHYCRLLALWPGGPQPTGLAGWSLPADTHTHIHAHTHTHLNLGVTCLFRPPRRPSVSWGAGTGSWAGAEPGEGSDMFKHTPVLCEDIHGPFDP